MCELRTSIPGYAPTQQNETITVNNTVLQYTVAADQIVIVFVKFWSLIASRLYGILSTLFGSVYNNPATSTQISC